MRNIVPDVVFKTRIRDEAIEGDNPYKWKDKTSDELFKNCKVILFSLPGTFTSTCSTYQLPNFEKLFNDFNYKIKKHMGNVLVISLYLKKNVKPL